MSKKNQNHYTDEFREQIVRLVKSGRSVGEIHEEYGISRNAIYSWVGKHDKSGSFRDRDNLSEQEKELIVLRKENKRLRMEADLLKQAALIMARK
jgi:transposase